MCKPLIFNDANAWLIMHMYLELMWGKMKNYMLLSLPSMLFMLSGCSSFGIDGPFMNSRTIQAEDRMLLVTEKGVVYNENGIPTTHKVRVVCAEPSPDALSALAFSGALEGDFEGQGIKASGAISQTLGELGERTPVIQMLRDSLYRACEAHMNGLLDRNQYDDILAFFDIYSATILGIESLTHKPRTPVIIESTSNSKATENDTEAATNSDKTSGGNNGNNNVGAAVPQENNGSATSISDGIAEKITSMLDGYYAAKAKLFYMMELRRLNIEGKLKSEQYLEKISPNHSNNESDYNKITIHNQQQRI